MKTFLDKVSWKTLFLLFGILLTLRTILEYV